MLVKCLPILALAGVGFTQQLPSLAEAIGNTTELSQLQGILRLNQTLLTALAGAQNITILAPSNTAFGRIDNATLQGLAANQGLITAVLEYHVLKGVYHASAITNTSAFPPSLLTNKLFTNVTGGQVVKATRRSGNVTFYSGLLTNSSVSRADLNFTGGTIHVIDRLLALPQTATDTLAAAGLSSLRGALNATNLTDTVNYTPDVTIFAPNNEAIRNIGSGLASLSPTQISDILKYHVVASGPIGYSSTLKNNTKLQTAGGQNLTITIGRGGVYVNNARVVTTDLLIANGVVHVIDQVLNPTNQTIGNSTATQGIPAFQSVSALSEAPYTSGQAAPTTTIAPGVISAAADPTSSSGSGSSSSSQAGAPAARQTGAVGLGALFGAAAIYFM